MPYSFNPFTSNLDETKTTQDDYYLIDDEGKKWNLDVDNAGVLITTREGGGFAFMDGAGLLFMDDSFADTMSGT